MAGGTAPQGGVPLGLRSSSLAAPQLFCSRSLNQYPGVNYTKCVPLKLKEASAAIRPSCFLSQAQPSQGLSFTCGEKANSEPRCCRAVSQDPSTQMEEEHTEYDREGLMTFLKAKW